MTTTRTVTKSTAKIPTPIYAAAGAGDIAYRQLRKLPEQVALLRERVVELRPAVAEAVSETSLRADLDRLRHAARRNASAFVAGAQQAQERAVAVYTDLVARGEKVVGNAKATETGTIEITPKTASVTAEIETAKTDEQPDTAAKAAPAAKKNTPAKK